MKIVISGALGFIGSEIARYIAYNIDDVIIYLLIRGNAKQTGEMRFDSLKKHWKKFFKIDDKIFKKFIIIDYDLEAKEPVPKEILGSEYFFHCAASTELNRPLTISRSGNLFSTFNAIKIARKMPGLKRFIHFSTAFVSGNKNTFIRENDLPGPYNNFYEQTKRESEDAVIWSGLPYTILRPSIVVGDSKTGYARNFKVIYLLLKMWKIYPLLILPINKKARLDIIPIDFLVRVTLKLCLEPSAKNQIFHICAGKLAPTSFDVIDIGFKQLNIKPVFIVSSLIGKFFCNKFIFKFLWPELQEIVRIYSLYLPYIFYKGRIFDTSKLRKIIGDDIPDFTDYGNNIFRFCMKTNWGKKSCLL